MNQKRRIITLNKSGSNDEKMGERMNAFKWMQEMHEKMPDDAFVGVDFEQEWQEALVEKYGMF